MATTMRAWRIMAPGPLEKNLRLVDDVTKPTAEALKPGQVLVKVTRAAINPADYKLPELGLATRAIVGFPLTPGMDLAGTIEAVGPNVDEKVKAGDAIMARLDPMKPQGALMEYVVLDDNDWADAEGADKDQAAGAGTVALTAHQSLKPYVKEGDKVFINGGGGGLGLMSIQIAKVLGCHVTVSCSAEKAEFCKHLGADEVIDYKKLDVTAELLKRGQVMQVIMDNVGNSPSDLYKRCDGILKEGGVYVYVGGRVSGKTMWNMGGSLLRPGFLGGQKRKFVMFLTKTVKKDLEEIARWMKEGRVKTVVDEVFGFEQVDKAYEKLKTDKCQGKVIVRVAE